MSEARAAAAEVLRLSGFTISQWRRRPPFQEGDAFERYLEGWKGRAAYPSEKYDAAA